MSMARKPDLVREMMEREQDHFEQNEEKIKHLILKETEHAQLKVAQLQSDIRALEQKLNTLHHQHKWIQLKWYSWSLHRKKRKLNYLKKISPSSTKAKEFLG